MDKKFQFNWYQANDAAAMERKLEKMAEKGWLLDEMTNWGFRYRRGEPGTVHYAVTYFPQASVYDAGPTEEQQTYADYCAAAGWEFVSNWGPLQIFRSTRVNPVPIETDESEKLQAIHKSMLKTWVLSYGMLLAVWIMNLILRFSSIKRNPLGFFSSNRDMLFIGFLLFFVAYMAFFLVDYFIWYFRSKREVERGEACLQPHTKIRFWLSMVLLGMCVLVFASWFGDASSTGSKWILAYSLGGMTVIALLCQGALTWMKRRGYDRKTARNTHIGLAVVLAVLYTAGIVPFVTRLNDAEKLREPDVEIYVDSRGHEWEIHHDELPVTLEDLGYTVTEKDHCTYVKEERRSPLMTQTTYEQRDCGEQGDLPYLRYWVAETEWDWLREYCLESLMRKQRISGLGTYTPDYELVDDLRWHAERVYTNDKGSDLSIMKVVLVCGEKLIYIQYGAQVTDQQIATIVEKLNLA